MSAAISVLILDLFTKVQSTIKHFLWPTSWLPFTSTPVYFSGLDCKDYHRSSRKPGYQRGRVHICMLRVECVIIETSSQLENHSKEQWEALKDSLTDLLKVNKEKHLFSLIRIYRALKKIFIHIQSDRFLIISSHTEYFYIYIHARFPVS